MVMLKVEDVVVIVLEDEEPETLVPNDEVLLDEVETELDVPVGVLRVVVEPGAAGIVLVEDVDEPEPAAVLVEELVLTPVLLVLCELDNEEVVELEMVTELVDELVCDRLVLVVELELVTELVDELVTDELVLVVELELVTELVDELVTDELVLVVELELVTELVDELVIDELVLVVELELVTELVDELVTDELVLVVELELVTELVDELVTDELVLVVELELVTELSVTVLGAGS